MEQQWTETTTETPVVFSPNNSLSIAKFAAAFVKAQKQIKGALKDATNPHFKNKYADLSSVMDACKDALNGNGIAIIQTPERCEAGRVALTTKLLHESGEWIAGTGEIPVDRNGPQAYGSALTYARRYFLSAMVGVCPEDDDGNGADNRGQQRDPREVDAERFFVTVDEAFDSREQAAQVGDPDFTFTPGDRRSICKGVAEKYEKESVADLPAQKRGEFVRAIVDGKFDGLRLVAVKKKATAAV